MKTIGAMGEGGRGKRIGARQRARVLAWNDVSAAVGLDDASNTKLFA